MAEAEKESVNFVIVPRMTSREAVSFLLDRFPAMRDRICPDEEDFDLATCVYDSFATEVVRRADEHDLFKLVIRFIDEIAESKDPTLRNVLEVCILEGIAADPDVARRVSGAVRENARRLLRDVERDFYHRKDK